MLVSSASGQWQLAQRSAPLTGSAGLVDLDGLDLASTSREWRTVAVAAVECGSVARQQHGRLSVAGACCRH